MQNNLEDGEDTFPPVITLAEIATSYRGQTAAVVRVNDLISVHDLSSTTRLSEFESSWDIGGRRLAISEDGKLCAAGAYERYGITLHDAWSGKPLWKRPDLKKVQNLKFSKHRTAVLVAMDDGPLRILDAQNGKDLESLRGLYNLWESPFGKHRFAEHRSGDYVLNVDESKNRFSIKRTSSDVLDVCFTPEFVALSEANGPMRVFSLRDGKLVWQHLEANHHILNLDYSQSTREIVGIDRHLRGEEFQLISFEKDTGTINRRINNSEFAIASFALQGSRVVTWRGNIIDVVSGEIVSRLTL